MARVYNFSAGPSMLPEDVFENRCCGNDGIRSKRVSRLWKCPTALKEYQAIFDETETEPPRNYEYSR